MSEPHKKPGLLAGIITFSILVIVGSTVSAQNYSLYNSRTLYDSFENPSQSAYQVDTSRRYAFNFFIPTLSVNSRFSGPAEAAFKGIIFDGTISGKDLSLGNKQKSDLYFNSNNYLGMFRILKRVKQNQELGLSWQVKSEGQLEVTNETFAVFDDYKLFTENSYTDLFNNQGFSQTYHQFSINYRQDLYKRLSVGVKGSLLSGIAYSQLKVMRSSLIIDQGEDQIAVGLAGRLLSNFKYDNVQKKMALPDFKNPGLAISAGAGYKARGGWFVMGNLKDLGFIRWNKNSYEYLFGFNDILIDNASSADADDRLADSISSRIDRGAGNKGYITAINGKAEVLINKNLGNYQPNLILSKNLFYKGGDIALVNNYSYKDLVLSLMGDYHTSGVLTVGGQFMVKSPNAEFFIGSDHLFKSLEGFKNASSGTYPYDSGPVAASFYMGFGLKFGPILEHPANANYIPGMDSGKERKGFFKRLFGKN